MSSSDSSILSSDSHLPRLPRERPSVQIDSDPPSPVRTDAPTNPVFEKRTLKKVDSSLLPALSLVYALAYVDVINLTIARREGADAEFNLLNHHRYYIISAAFFLPYILLQLPFNFALRRVGGATWLGTVLFLLGAVQISLGFVNNWGQFLGVRTILGLLQAVILPGCVYLISSWYIRFELQKRLALFYSASVFFASFANILALGLSKIHLRNMQGWRWIFAIEGVVTVFVSFYAYTHILSFPDQPKVRVESILSEDEINLMRQRVELDRRDYVPDNLTGAKLRQYLSDGTIWVYGFLSMSSAMIVYSLQSTFISISLPGRNFSDVERQLLFIPPGIIATALVIPTGVVSDRLKLRGPVIIFLKLLTIIGISMFGFSGRPGVKYAGCILAYACAQANVPTMLTYQANNIRRHSKRLVTISLIASLGGAGGLLSVVAFPLSAAPKFRAGVWLALALQIAGVFVVFFLMLWMHRRNMAADKALGLYRDEYSVGHLAEVGRPRRRPAVSSRAFIEGLDSFRYTL